MIKLCIANRKGGVSKTTTAVSLSSILVELGHKVLLVDLDPQGDASDNMGFDIDSLENTTYEIITGRESIVNTIQPTAFGVDVIPSNSKLAEAEVELASKINREKILSDAIDESNLQYDFIVFDLPPNLGLLSINGLVASDSVIISVDVGRFSLSGIGDLLEIINLIRKSNLKPTLDVLGVVMTKVDYRTRMAKVMRQTLQENVGDRVFKTRIRQNAAVAESQNHQAPINHYDKKSSGYKEYLKFTEEVLEKCQITKVIK